VRAVSKPVWHIPLPCVQRKTPDDGQRNCLKHVEFYSKNKFEKFVHLVGFIVRFYHDARSPERQIYQKQLGKMDMSNNYGIMYTYLFVVHWTTSSLVHYTGWAGGADVSCKFGIVAVRHDLSQAQKLLHLCMTSHKHINISGLCLVLFNDKLPK